MHRSKRLRHVAPTIGRSLHASRGRAAPLCIGAVLILVLAQSALAAKPASAPAVATASDSPPTYTGCTTGATSSPSFNYRNSEVEPFISGNPTNKSNLIAVWQQDRWSNGGAHGLTAGSSNDGGKTWTDVPLPFDACAAPNDVNVNIYNRASDPWVSVGPDGRAYAVSISVNVNTNDNGVFATTSADGGSTWSSAKALKTDAGTSTAIFEVTQFFNDKESVTADPTQAGTAYAVWDRLVSPSSSFEADIRSKDFHGPTWFSKTTNGGQTWQTKQIFDPGNKNQTIGNVVVVDPTTGTLYDFFNMILSSGPSSPRGFNVAFLKSIDGGDTWSGPTIVDKLLSVPVTDPTNIDPRTNNPPAPSRTSDFNPEVAIDPATGHLYAVWEDGRFSGGGHDDIVITTSADGGATWSPAKRVDAPNGQFAFTPNVAVASDGTVGVSYYQWQSTSTGSELADYWIRRASPSAIVSTNTDSLDATAATHVSGPFNTLDAPFAGGYFLGDYNGLTSVGTSFSPVFVATTCTNLSCRALTSVTNPANRAPTGNNSTDVLVGRGF